MRDDRSALCLEHANFWTPEKRVGLVKEQPLAVTRQLGLMLKVSSKQPDASASPDLGFDAVTTDEDGAASGTIRILTCRDAPGALPTSHYEPRPADLRQIRIGIPPDMRIAEVSSQPRHEGVIARFVSDMGQALPVTQPRRLQPGRKRLVSQLGQNAGVILGDQSESKVTVTCRALGPSGGRTERRFHLIICSRA